MAKSALIFLSGAIVLLSCTTTGHAAQLIGGDSIGPDSTLTNNLGGFAAGVDGPDILDSLRWRFFKMAAL